jgi:hypothetical protein
VARTEAGAELTRRHHGQQLQVRAAALRSYMRLWPLWELDDASTYQRLVAASLPLVRSHYQASSVLAGGYYEAHRRAELVEGPGALRLAEPLPRQQIVTSLYVTGEVQASKALAAGHSPESVRQNALVRTSGAVGRLVLMGGRMTLVRSSYADRAAGGWRRVVGGEPCSFCLMLAGRGAVYSDATVDFQAHDHCSCSAEPSYT